MELISLRKGKIISREQKIERIKHICMKCGAKCCKPSLIERPFHLNLKPGDLSKLLDLNLHSFLAISAEETFLFMIVPHIFGYCPFLSYQKNICLIHTERPSMCREYPFDPRGYSTRDLCLLWNILPASTRDKIEIKYLKKRNKSNFNEEREKRINKDLERFDQELKSHYNIHLTMMEYLNNSYGSFLIKKHMSANSADLMRFLSFIDYFRQNQDLEEIILSVRIVDNIGTPLYFVRGCFCPNKTIPQTKIRDLITQKAKIYYLEEMDGSYLEGVVSLRDIYSPLSKWKTCWKKIQKIGQIFKTKRQNTHPL